MKVLIVSTNRNYYPAPVMPIGACAAAEAAEGAGHEVGFLDLMLKKDSAAELAEALSARRPNVLGLSVRNVDNNNMRDPVAFYEELDVLMEVIRRTGPLPVVLGGAAVRLMAEELLRYTGAQWAVLGNGEQSFPALLHALSGKGDPRRVPGVSWLEKGSFKSTAASRACPTMSSCLAPDYGRWINVKAYLSRLATVPVQTKRGCPYRCVYCTYRVIEGRDYQLSCPSSVAEAVKRLAAEGLRDIEFVDNVFNAPYEHALRICECLAREPTGARLHSLEINPLFVRDELLDLMERAGFVSLGITAESAHDAVLRGLGKNYSADHLYKAAAAVNRHRMSCIWLFMLGGPGETADTVRETLRFTTARIRPDDMAFFNIGVRVYPGTELAGIAAAQGLPSSRDKKADMLTPCFYFSPGLDLDWLMGEMDNVVKTHSNHIVVDTVRKPVLPWITRLGYKVGLKPPLWKHTLSFRNKLKLLGVDL